jgi:hypothetical protein
MARSGFQTIGARPSRLIFIHDSHHEVSSVLRKWPEPMECAGRAQRRRRFGPRRDHWFWRTTGRDLRQSGVALRLPPHSIMSGTSRTSQSRTDSCELRIRMRPLAFIFIHNSHHEVSSVLRKWPEPMECAGRAQRRRRFGPRGDRWFWRTTGRDLRQSGVALCLPPHSIMSGISRTSQSRTDSCELRIRMRHERRASTDSSGNVAVALVMPSAARRETPCVRGRVGQSSCRVVT